MKVPATVLLTAVLLSAQTQRPAWTAQEQPIADRIRTLRQLPDDVRTEVTKQLALQIRAIPAVPNKLRLASGLASLSTEGDFGRQTLQEVATTLAMALREQPPPSIHGEPDGLYSTLAQLVKYEGVQATIDAPGFADAMARLEAVDQQRRAADFTLTGLQGQSWTLKSLRGKVVLVNFWATWCQPCRKEMPDLQTLHNEFKDRGLVILAITSNDIAKVKPFIDEHRFTYPILLDPDRKANDAFRVDGIPKSFLFDREGKLAAQAIDMRTRGQFLQMLSRAGLGAEHAPEQPLLLQPAELPYEGGAVKTAWVWRAPDRSTADAIIRWPAGVIEGGKPEPTSTHPFAVRIAVIEGTLLFQFEGGLARELKPGSYILAPANVKHYLGCKAGGPECVMFAVFTPDPIPPR